MKFEYTIRDEIAFLFINVDVARLGHEDRKLPVTALLDTGADHSLIPLWLINKLNIHPRVAEESILINAALGGPPTLEETYAAKVFITGLIEAEITAIKTEHNYMLLGLDVLNKLVLNIDPKKNYFMLRNRSQGFRKYILDYLDSNINTVTMIEPPKRSTPNPRPGPSRP